jgi:hypothetical protein
MEMVGTPEQITALYGALLKAQAEYPPIPKTKQAYNYKYAPLYEIHEKIRPVLLKHDLAVFHHVDRKDGKQVVGTSLVHILGGRLSCDGLAVPEGIKITEQGGYVTYSSRYGYCAMLGLTSEDEDEERLTQKAAAMRKPKREAVETPSILDPSLPTKLERAEFVNRLGFYRKQVNDDALVERYLLRESGATEVRLIPQKQWVRILSNLAKAHSEGKLLEVVSAT